MSSRPTLAKPAKGPAGAFGALLVAATDEPDAANGLALAYAALSPPQRRDLIPAVVADARAEGVCPSLLLASLLGVEQNADIARLIAEAIGEARSSELQPAAPTRALMAGDAQEGGALLIRPLHGHFVEVLALAWNPHTGVTHARAESLVATAEADTVARHLPGGLRLEDTPVAFAVDTLTGALWHHRQLHGSLPDDVAQFAEIFSQRPRG